MPEVAKITERELIRRCAEMFGWELQTTLGDDRFTREGERLDVDYRRSLPWRVYNEFVREGETFERTAHIYGADAPLYRRALHWLAERHDRVPKEPFVADSEGVVSR